MSDQMITSSELEDLAEQIGGGVETFLVALQAVARGEAGSAAVSVLLLQVSQVLLAGARLGVQNDFEPAEEYEPDAGPDPDLDEMRLRLARLLDGVDAYQVSFDPYADPPELVDALLSDELTAIALDLAHGLRHLRAGRIEEALWWWQFSYVNSWGNSAVGVLSALQSILAHDRLDHDELVDESQVQAAEEMLAHHSDTS